MKKRILTLCFAVISIALFMSVLVGAADFQVESKGFSTVEITKFVISSDEVVIPDTDENGKRIVSIAPDAFVLSSGVDSVKTLKIGANINSLSTGVFAKYFDKLETIEVSTQNRYFKADDNVLFSYDMRTLIKYSAGNEATEYTIPKTVTAVAANAFEGCKNLVKIDLGTTLRTVGADAFASCTSLSEISIPKSISAISEGCFKSCTALEKLTVAEGVKTIGDEAFSGCTALSDITIPESLTAIGTKAFDATAAINDADNKENCCVYICDHLVKVDSSADGRLALRSGTITMTPDAFSSVTEITELLLPMSLKNVPAEAFKTLTKLQIMVVAGYSTTFEKKAFIPGESFDRFYFCEGSGAHEYFTEELYGMKRKATMYKYISDDFRLTIDNGLRNTGAIQLCVSDVDSADIPETVVAEFESSNIAAYTIHLVRSGKNIAPGATVTYSLSLPEEFVGRVNRIYHIDEKNNITWLASTYNTENITFSTSKTGMFVVGNIEKPGDVDHDAHVDISDVVLLAQYIAGWQVSRFDPYSADVNADGEVSIGDAVLLSQYVAGWAVVPGETQPVGFPFDFVAFDPYTNDFALDYYDVLTIKKAITDGTGVYSEIKIASINGVSTENLPYEAFCNYVDARNAIKQTDLKYSDFEDLNKLDAARKTTLYKKTFKSTVIKFLMDAIAIDGYSPDVFTVESVNEDGSLHLTSNDAIGDYNRALLGNYKASSSTVYTFITANGIYHYTGNPAKNHKIVVSDAASVVCYGLQIVVCDLSKNVDEIAIGSYDYYTTYTDEDLVTQKRNHTDTWRLK